MNQMQRVLIFSTVWPEPQSSAAGVRLMQWVNFFLRAGYSVTISSPAQIKLASEWGYFVPPPGVEILPLPLNQSETANVLKILQPTVVMFDRFILEEQFGHYVYQTCPEALVLLETQDLHFVRRARESAQKVISQVQTAANLNFKTETALRETASIYRCDLSFVVSSFEKYLLSTEFQIGEEWVQWVPFLYEEPVLEKSTAWSEGAFAGRSGFSWVGNFRHAPNRDGLRWFKKEIWPQIRAQLPTASVSVWGAYPPAEVMQFHDPRTGFLVKGHAENLETVFADARVNLAPLQYGAGIKGKILEGFRRGIPVVTTSIGSEGLRPHPNDRAVPEWFQANDSTRFAEHCIALHEDEHKWKEAQNVGRNLLETIHALSAHEDSLRIKITQMLAQKKSGELPRWLSKIGRHEHFNSHRYFSKWLELKERK